MCFPVRSGNISTWMIQNMKLVISTTTLLLTCSVASADLIDDLFPDYANPTKGSWDKFTIEGSDATFTMANDLFSARNHDRYFSNGLWQSWSKANDNYYLISDSGKFKRITADKLNEFNAPLVKKISHGITVGQHMYTPDEIRDRPEKANTYDRPYAGFLFASFNTFERSTSAVDHHSWAIGCIGPCSAAAEAQTWAHEVLSPGSPKPQGWSTQVKNQPAIQFSRSRYYYNQLGTEGRGIHGGTFWRAEYGSVFNRAGGGLHAAWTLLGDKECPTISFDASSGIPKNRGLNPIVDNHFMPPEEWPDAPKPVTFELPCESDDSYLSLNASAGFTGVLSNTLIEGGIHTDSGVIRHKAAPLFTELKVGMGFQKGNWSLSYNWVVRSPEVDTTGYVWDRHQWGEFSLTWRNSGKHGLALPFAVIGLGAAIMSGQEDTDE